MQNVISIIQNHVCQMFYSVQLNIESIHTECYSLLIDTIIEDEKEKNKLFAAIEQMPIVKKKAEFCLSRMQESLPLAERLFVFALFEGVAFSSSFAGIFAIKNMYPSLMPALTTSNEFISRDESLHADFAALVYRQHIVNKLSEERAHVIVRELMKIETEFCHKSVPFNLIMIDPAKMVQYVEFCADIVLKNFGISTLYNHKKCPLQFMHLLSLQSKANFFEKRETSYSKAKDTTRLKLVSDF